MKALACIHVVAWPSWPTRLERARTRAHTHTSFPYLRLKSTSGGPPPSQPRTRFDPSPRFDPNPDRCAGCGALPDTSIGSELRFHQC
eukprot:15470726-Alexandrium_andersonii.AAC.2